MNRRIFTAALLLWLAGCAAVPPAPQRPAAISVFAFAGRIALRQGETSHHANIDWRHAPEGDTVLLTTPLGQGVAELERDAAGARLTLADGRRYAAADWDELARGVFGLPLPLRAATHWLLGAEGDAATADGWRMSVLAREGAGPGALPTSIEFARDDIVVRLKIDEWIDVK